MTEEHRKFPNVMITEDWQPATTTRVKLWERYYKALFVHRGKLEKGTTSTGAGGRLIIFIYFDSLDKANMLWAK